MVGEKGRLSVSEIALEFSWAGFKFEPHSPQNLKFGELLNPQLGHFASNLLPHSTQNFTASGF
jgi:hypothetical protein